VEGEGEELGEFSSALLFNEVELFPALEGILHRRRSFCLMCCQMVGLGERGLYVSVRTKTNNQ
jgi:hypothetical protein